MKENHVMMLWDFTHNDNSFLTMHEKGYPKLFSDPAFIVVWNQETYSPLGYCCYKDMGKYLLVGNIYVHPHHRKQGIFTSLRGFRCKLIQSMKKPAIGIMQPLEGIDPMRIVKHITEKDTDIVKDYDCVKDIISKEDYESINCHILVRYREDFYAEEKTGK